jgi:hypothetical protein
MKLLAGEKFTACLVEMEMGPCLNCGYIGYRVLVVQSAGGDRRRVTVCGQHFADACAEHPEIRELERFRLDPRSPESVAMQPVIRCPRCGAQLDLGEHGAYKIILATGIICVHCHARIVIEHNVARPES